MSSSQKTHFHPKNPYNTRYDLNKLAKVLPALKKHIFVNDHGNQTLNFANPEAVKALNKALLLQNYELEYWDIPDGYLCPPIPGRADYLFHIKSFLKKKRGGIDLKEETINCLDIGTGASCIYPIIGVHEFGWKFVASEFEYKAFDSAQLIIEHNPSLSNNVELRLQHKAKDIFRGIVKKHEYYHVSICNPPFHASAKEAAKGSQRKAKNLKINNKKGETRLNFGGQPTELWCEGGELKFITNMAVQSRYYSHSVRWFTTLVSKGSNLKRIYDAIKQAGAKDIETIEMESGNKKTRIVAWTFLPPVKKR